MKTSEIAIAANILESRKCPTASASCRKVAEFDTPLLCERRHDNDENVVGDDDDDDNKILCKQEGRRMKRTRSRSRHRCCSSVAEFSMRNSVSPPGEKTSGNVLVKLTELRARARGYACPVCRLRIPLLRQTSRRYSLRLRGYGIVVSRVCLSNLRCRKLPRSVPLAGACVGILRESRSWICVCPATRKRESTAVLVTPLPLPLVREVHLAINHTVLLIVLKSCHARVTSLFHVQESRTSSTLRDGGCL